MGYDMHPCSDDSEVACQAPGSVPTACYTVILCALEAVLDAARSVTGSKTWLHESLTSFVMSTLSPCAT